MKSSRLRILGPLVCALAMAASGAAVAQSTVKANAFSIAPLGSTLTIKPQGRTAQEVFHVSNTGQNEVTLDAEVFSWEQNELGESVYSPTKDFLLYPKTVTIKAGQTRAVRLMRRANLEQPRSQQYYRVQFRELAPLVAQGDERDNTEVTILTRVLLPLVVQPENFSEEARFEVLQGKQGLFIRNNSKALVKLSNAYCDGEKVSGLLYVHPGVEALLSGVKCTGKLKVEREAVGETEHEVKAVK